MTVKELVEMLQTIPNQDMQVVVRNKKAGFKILEEKELKMMSNQFNPQQLQYVEGEEWMFYILKGGSEKDFPSEKFMEAILLDH